MAIRKEVHTRCKFASDQFNYWTYKLATWGNFDIRKPIEENTPKGSLIGNHPQKFLKKLNQANRIWHYYCDEFGQEFKN